MLQRVKKLGNSYTRRSVLRSGLAAPGIVAAVLGDPLPSAAFSGDITY